MTQVIKSSQCECDMEVMFPLPIKHVPCNQSVYSPSPYLEVVPESEVVELSSGLSNRAILSMSKDNTTVGRQTFK